MSLPTPPSTSHRDKENRLPAGSRNISWSLNHQYHTLTDSLSSRPPSRASGSRSPPPPKSILKKTSHVLLPFEDDNEACQRETTPEPSDPLADLKYLESTVTRIVSNDASLRDLIEAYSVLAARLRAAVTGTTDADASWPLFQPLRKNRQLVVDALVRDLGRALEDPASADSTYEKEKVSLPSPKNSPNPKRRHGMTAEQVKYARDLCTTCHAVMKLLAVVFTLPAVYRVFTDEQLQTVVTQVLAIPLADDLPTPNARKTCALSIWLLQTQRLPAEVLSPASDRIAYALRRGIEGELGKEGKKGSANDGLKAIHELSTFRPETFLAPFASLVPSVLANLLAPTLALRSQASHALGGLALALSSLPISSATLKIHSQMSEAVANFLTTSPSTPSKSPTKDPVIIRTLRATIQATEPQQAAQGPVWAMTVLSSLIVLLGPRMYTDPKVTKAINALLSFTMKHKKTSVRALGCVLWRCITWVWFRPPFEDDDVVTEDDDSEENKPREKYWRLVKSVVDVGAGVSTIAALLRDDLALEDDDAMLRRVMEVMHGMIKKGGHSGEEAMDVLRIFLSFESDDESSACESWNHSKLLPNGLFDALPGILTAEYKTLVTSVRNLAGECPHTEDVRSLTREEVAKDWVFDELVSIWRNSLSHLQITTSEAGTPREVMDVWEGLIKANVSSLQDAHEEAGIERFAVRAVEILIEILRDSELDMTTKAGPPPKELTSSSPVKTTRATPSSLPNNVLKLSLVHDLWTATANNVPHGYLAKAAERLLATLVDSELELVWDTELPTDDARKHWAGLCAQVMLVGDSDELRHFWLNQESRNGWSRSIEVRTFVWTCFLQKWTQASAWSSWQDGVLLLGLPFIDKRAWNLTNDDFGAWENFLECTVNKAFDHGVDCSTVLNHVASTVSDRANIAFADSARVADMLLGHFEVEGMREVPSELFEFINDTLRATYPPEPRNRVTSSWLLRTLTRVIEGCPAHLAMPMFEILQDGISIWISDAFNAYNMQEYEDEVVPLYQMALCYIGSLPRTLETLDAVSVILESAFWGREDKPASLSDAFTDFWHNTYSSLEVPANGWPERIQHCLESVNWPVDREPVIDPVLLAEDAAAYDADTSMDQDSVLADETFELPTPDDEEEPLEFPESEDEEEANPHTPAADLASLIKSAALGHLGPAVFTPYGAPSRTKLVKQPEDDSDVPTFKPVDPPSTPARVTVHKFTPPRPEKNSVDSSALLTLLSSSPTTPLPISSRGFTTPRSSPSKRRRLGADDKENMSPRHAIASFTERLAMRSVEDSILGKRRAVDDWREGFSVKKGKANSGQPTPSPRRVQSSSAGDSDEERSVEETLLAPSSDDVPLATAVVLDDPFTTLDSASAASSDASDYADLSEVSPKKRKRAVIDSAELPKLRDLLRENALTSTPKKRRTRSASLASLQSSVLSDVQSDAHNSLDKSSKKRTRRSLRRSRSRDAFADFNDSEEAEVIQGSDDSVVWIKKPYTQAPVEVALSSSDDDPHTGQVTPHHLISPAIRRVQDNDPPSDDSIMSSSPSRDLATRRKQRASFAYLKQSPVNMA